MSKITTTIVAAAAGFVAGILLAPKSGKETRADIKRASIKAKDKTVEVAGVVKEKTAAGFEVARSGAADAGREIGGFFGRAGRDAKKTAGAVAEKSKETGKGIRDAVK